jgi:hypothetical protein
MAGKTPLVLGLTGLMIVIAGGLSYFALTHLPWFRSGWPNFALMVVGAALGLYAAGHGGKLLKVLAGADVVLLLLFAFALNVAFRLPVPGTAPQTAAFAPDFSLPDHTGTPLTLSSLRGKGPVLLVFYRGHW